MADTEKIVDAGGAVGIEVDGKLIRVASIDGTRTADLVQVLRTMLENAREQGRQQAMTVVEAA